jgi:hypothetical protein
MKNKLFVMTVLAACLSFSPVFAQYDQQPPSQPGAGTGTGKAGGKKPGEVLTGGAIVATPITEEEAKKKYPMPGGKAYPMGDRDIHQPSGWIYSPYTRQLYDCTQIPFGGLVLDTKVNKVFVRPKTK